MPDTIILGRKMGESLISIISVDEISPSKSNDIKSLPTLLFLPETTRDALHQYTRYSAIHPPVDPSFTSPFLGRSFRDIARSLSENANVGSLIDLRVFLVADERTAEDGDMLLLVDTLGDDQRQNEGEFILQYVRIAADPANIAAVAVSVATSGVGELVILVDGDGLSRGGHRSGKQPPRKGEKAPKKRI